MVVIGEREVLYMAKDRRALVLAGNASPPSGPLSGSLWSSSENHFRLLLPCERERERDKGTLWAHARWRMKTYLRQGSLPPPCSALSLSLSLFCNKQGMFSEQTDTLQESAFPH